MVSVMALWLPILVAAILVFIASSVIHMALKYHNSDVAAVPREADVMAALRPFNIPPGDYALPKPGSMKEMGTPEFQEKMRQGPVALLSFYPSGPMAINKSLVQWFIYTLVVGVFAAYIAGRALAPGAEYLQVFRFTGATAFLGYTLALWQDSIWWNRSWTTTVKHTFDGLLYALLTAGAFGWLWPS